MGGQEPERPFTDRPCPAPSRSVVPELHGVEGFRLGLAGILRDTTARALARRPDGHRLGAPRRHGNWLILPADGPAVDPQRPTGHLL
jgi:hypothetical protein